MRNLGTNPKKTPDPGSTTCSTPPASPLPADAYTGGIDYRTGCGVDRTYGPATGTTWATHPAFTFGTTELPGLWVAKFEITGSVAAPTVKPNLKSQNRQALGHNLASMKSRMWKNSDWGAAT